jgi:hypothetical protein
MYALCLEKLTFFPLSNSHRQYQEFYREHRTGRLLNNGETGAESTLTAVLGRMAAYSRREVSWDEMLRG